MAQLGQWGPNGSQAQLGQWLQMGPRPNWVPGPTGPQPKWDLGPMGPIGPMGPKARSDPKWHPFIPNCVGN